MRATVGGAMCLHLVPFSGYHHTTVCCFWNDFHSPPPPPPPDLDFSVFRKFKMGGKGFFCGSKHTESQWFLFHNESQRALFHTESQQSLFHTEYTGVISIDTRAKVKVGTVRRLQTAPRSVRNKRTPIVTSHGFCYVNLSRLLRRLPRGFLWCVKKFFNKK